MAIVTMDPPPQRRGRTRLSDEDIHQLAIRVSAGEAAGDGDPADHYQTANQRALSAKKRVEALNVPCGHRVWLDEGGYHWALTPPIV